MPEASRPGGEVAPGNRRRDVMAPLAFRLVQLIEMHSDRLAETMLMKLQSCDKCGSFERVPREEFRQRVYEIYEHLGEWLTDKREEEVARRSGCGASGRACC
jgi:hypothetical protein